MNRKRNRRILYYCYKSKNIRTILGGASIWRWAIHDKHLNFREWFYDNYNFTRNNDIGIGSFRNNGYKPIGAKCNIKYHIESASHFNNKKLSDFR